MPKYTIEDAKIVLTQEEIAALFTRIAPDDIFGEYREGLAHYLDFATAQSMGLVKEGVTADQWGEFKNDQNLREDMMHYRDW